jgi:hypothetical protein
MIKACACSACVKIFVILIGIELNGNNRVTGRLANLREAVSQNQELFAEVLEGGFLQKCSLRKIPKILYFSAINSIPHPRGRTGFDGDS